MAWDACEGSGEACSLGIPLGEKREKGEQEISYFDYDYDVCIA